MKIPCIECKEEIEVKDGKPGEIVEFICHSCGIKQAIRYPKETSPEEMEDVFRRVCKDIGAPSYLVEEVIRKNRDH